MTYRCDWSQTDVCLDSRILTIERKREDPKVRNKRNEEVFLIRRNTLRWKCFDRFLLGSLEDWDWKNRDTRRYLIGLMCNRSASRNSEVEFHSFHVERAWPSERSLHSNNTCRPVVYNANGLYRAREPSRGLKMQERTGPATAATAIMANNSLSDCQALRRPTQNCRTPRVHCAYGVPWK